MTLRSEKISWSVGAGYTSGLCLQWAALKARLRSRLMVSLPSQSAAEAMERQDHIVPRLQAW